MDRDVRNLIKLLLLVKIVVWTRRTEVRIYPHVQSHEAMLIVRPRSGRIFLVPRKQDRRIDR